MSQFDGNMIVLGVTGGIAAYKAAAVASLLVQAGAHVEVIMTESARQFVQPLTFSALTHATVHTGAFAPWTTTASGHISLASNADLVVVAPATATTIARIALGLADDLLGLVALSTQAPLLLAPAMEDSMFHHPATQEHLSTLVARGATLVGPERGRLASGATGDGRMAEPAVIVECAGRILARSRLLAGASVVVTAGGTREPLDPVRYIGNRSGGRMGFALAEAALAAGAQVTVISAPTAQTPPTGATAIEVETTAEMQAAVERATREADILIMAAAVADFRPDSVASSKIKKAPGQEQQTLQLVRNPDILASLDRPGLLKVGFAAETEDLIANAAAKLNEKRLAMIVANDAAKTIGAMDSEAIILTADGDVTPLPRMAKEALATEIIRTVAALWSSARNTDR